MESPAGQDDINPFALAWSQKCPRCGIGDLYNPGLSLTMRDICAHCGLDFARNDSADGPAVFLIFILGFLLVPAALALESIFAPPLWVHIVVWGIVSIGATAAAIRPLKAYMIALQFKYRADDWDQ